ncbi:acyl carrier protein [Myxococcus sp. MISCRS1]|uniref:phosphopantetheine-binding protein n=1 Tax=Myxococcus TaxID=32 RepID=UPI001144ADA1|nr:MULTISPECIES: acyl carrier protein [unclassified Myxococcus]MBZ4396285.1 acyl carrier protein [Myxococcus sp. AS-1-15]MBZ4413088.1 acyl carrier protein [Myxococcus sp. XM-1-1-1]MCK8498794.1 acyl carrier protein [Myxococcus fulvus]BDT37795.1 acyl carrier protein [Myxococcus sp. MH1]MCY1000661.1 acyl carrier protein [Myxococcus sp. MISCRS1]
MAELELEVLAEIRRIAAEELEWKGEVEPGLDLLKDLQLDSLGLTVLAVGLENRFRIRLSEEDAQGVRTVGDLTKLVERRVLSTARVATEVRS